MAARRRCYHRTAVKYLSAHVKLVWNSASRNIPTASVWSRIFDLEFFSGVVAWIPLRPDDFNNIKNSIHFVCVFLPVAL